jgi:hypothetical protein
MRTRRSTPEGRRGRNRRPQRSGLSRHSVCRPHREHVNRRLALSAGLQWSLPVGSFGRCKPSPKGEHEGQHRGCRDIRKRTRASEHPVPTIGPSAPPASPKSCKAADGASAHLGWHKIAEQRQERLVSAQHPSRSLAPPGRETPSIRSSGRDAAWLYYLVAASVYWANCLRWKSARCTFARSISDSFWANGATNEPGTAK